MLISAQKGGYAVGAFNTENLEMTQAIVRAAEETNSPVIIQTTPTTVKYAGAEQYFAVTESLARNSKADIALHLDHGDSIELVRTALEAGYTSVMIDGSKLDLAENIALTKEVVETALTYGVPVEAELGKLAGKEDDTVGKENTYTDPLEAAEFVSKTGVDSLAVSIGTAHGVYKGIPVLDVERLREIRKVVDIPLVLHGASGLSENQVKECIAAGICKVNYATELRQAFSDGVKDYLNAHPDEFDPKKYLARGRERVKETVKEKIELLSNGK
jgi:tagatose 1,6-diphosphate aldolase GatY/KbaY